MSSKGSSISSLRPGWTRLHTVLVLWTLAVLTGFGVLTTYSRTPGSHVHVLEQWPRELGPFQQGRHALVLFLHPKCPCSHASLEQFNRILGRTSALLDARIFFVRPRGVESGWEQTSLYSFAKIIPGIHVEVDDAGSIARRFGATTSGHAFLFGPSGQLLFEGGITSERGHAGDNPGADAVLAGLENKRTGQSSLPVFGCPLME